MDFDRNKGDVTELLENIMLSENEDIERFVNLIEEKIKSQEVKQFPKWEKTKKKIRLLPDESEEIKKREQEELADLSKQILMKHKNTSNNFFAALEMKYGGKGGKSEYDLDDDEFEKIQKSMMEKKVKRKANEHETKQKETKKVKK